MSESDNKKPEAETEKKQPSTDSADSKSRRRQLLKAGGVIASTYAVQEKWHKPVVDKVLLPAHAQTSPVPTPSPSRPMTPGPTPAPTPQPTMMVSPSP